MKVAMLAVCLAIAATAAAQTSPDNARVPPLTSVRGSDGAVYTLAPGGTVRAVLRNGADTQGGGSQLLAWKGVVYVHGDDAQWYQYTGAAGWPWMVVGADPSGGPIVVPLPPVVPQPPVVVPVPGPPVVVPPLSRIGWIQPGRTIAQAVLGTTTLYVDTVGKVIVGVTCSQAVGAEVVCLAPLPALTPGAHTLALTYKVSPTAVESAKSAVLNVTTTTSLTPIGLSLRP